MSSWSPTKYKAKNWPSYNTALNLRRSLSIWFAPEMVWIPPPNGKRGRQQSFSDAAIQACLTLKVLFGMRIGDVSKPDFEAVFEELERWNDVLKDHKHELRGPRP